MGLVIRQSIFTTIISYAGAVVGYVNLLYLYPKFLDPEQVGLLRTIQDAAILFAPFAQFGVTLSIFRYYPQLAKDAKSESGFVSLILLFTLAGFGMFVILFKIFESRLLSYFEDNARAILSYASVVLWLTFIVAVTAVMEAYSRSLLKTVVPQLLKEVVVRLLMALLVILYFLGYLSYEGFIYSTVLAWLISLLLLVTYLVSEKRLSLNFDFSFISRDKLKEVAKYSLFNFAGTAGLILVGKIDSMMVAGLVGLASVAVYTTAFYMAAVIEIPKKALTNIAMPLISRAFEKNDIREIKILYQKTSINQFIVGALLLIGIYINIDNVFVMMPRREIYEAGKWVVVLVGIGKLADMAFGPSSEIIVLSKYYAFNILLIVLLALIVIVANNYFIPAYGINGAALGAALALIGFNTAKFVFIWIRLGIQPFTLSTAKVIFISAVALGLNWIIPAMFNFILDIAVRSFAVTIVFCGLIYIMNVSPDANAFLARSILRVRSLLK